MSEMISLENVSFDYESEGNLSDISNAVIKNVNLSIKKGSFVALFLKKSQKCHKYIY